MLSFSSRKPLFWTTLSLLSLIGIVFTIRFFSHAFPIVNLNLSMNATQARTKAQELAQKYNLGPQEFKQATMFDVDERTQIYVELEAGGASAFNTMVTGTLYSPFVWMIRHFKEYETEETTVRFKPDGTPYGFVQTIPESQLGAKLDTKTAQSIAEQASSSWMNDLHTYKLIESSQDVKPNGRIDHTFVYERPSITIGQGFYRVKLVVSGDKLTELTHFIKIPESFTRRYQEMRSANTTLASSAFIVVYLLYLFFGCGLGLFILVRQRWILWRPALIWALIIASLQLFSSFNELPLKWFNYNTALSSHTFLLQITLSTLSTFLTNVITLAVSLTVAEGLTRKAFGHHLQLWNLWKPNIANSLAVLGRTVGGYLTAGIELGYVIAIYLFTLKYLGWWVPSYTTVDPNILSTPFPWLGATANALHAGFWEEALFRAVPLSIAALIGERFNKRTLFLCIGFVVQALVFSAAHASYPNFPFYARLVELLLPSTIFGAVYLMYGLLPSIISHFIYDLVLMALPLFASSAPGSHFDQALIILIGLLPLLIVLGMRLRHGLWNGNTTHAHNIAWIPTAAPDFNPTQPVHQPLRMSKTSYVLIIGLGIGGALAWAWNIEKTNNALPVTITRNQAIEKAQQELIKKRIVLSSDWTTLSSLHGQNDVSDRFVWQKTSPDAYRHLMKQFYLDSPYWLIKFVRFTGTTDERTEYYQLALAGDGSVIHFFHYIPEARPGENLTESQARTIVHQTLKDTLHLNPQSVIEISKTPTKHPARTDWEFVFNNTALQLPDKGQARISISVAGNEIVGYNRYIHVPEAWIRYDQNQQSLLATLRWFMQYATLIILSVLAVLFFLYAPHQLSDLFFLWIFVFFLSLINAINTWPLLLSRFKTAEPWSHQLFKTISFTGISLLWNASLTSLLLYAMLTYLKPLRTTQRLTTTILGISWGFMISGSYHLLRTFLEPKISPWWADYSSLNGYLPSLGTITETLSSFMSVAPKLAAFVIILKLLEGKYLSNRILMALAALAIGFILAIDTAATVQFWGILGVVFGGIVLVNYLLFTRYEPTAVISFCATIIGLPLLRELMAHAYPRSSLHYGIALTVVCGFTWYMYHLIHQE